MIIDLEKSLVRQKSFVKETPSIQLRLHKAWKKLKDAQKKQAQFEEEFEQVVQLYCERVLPKEREVLLTPSCALVEHLISFLPRKSLPDWQRNSLLDWIEQLIANISRLDSKKADELRDKVVYAVKSSIKKTELQQADDGEFNMDDIMQELEKQWKEESNCNHWCFEKSNRQINQNNEKYTQEKADTTSDTTQFSQVELEGKSLIEAPWLVSLFRRAAQALHPDREQDKAQQLIKSQLLKQLIQARKNGDVMTILQLHAEYVQPIPGLQEPEMEQVLFLIERQIKTIKLAQEAYILQYPERAYAYDMVYARTRKQQDANIKDAMNHLYQLRDSLIYCRKNITSLKSLSQFFK